MRDSLPNRAVRFLRGGRSACSSSMKEGLSTHDVAIGPVNEKSRSVSLPPTVLSLMGDMKEKMLSLGT